MDYTPILRFPERGPSTPAARIRKRNRPFPRNTPEVEQPWKERRRRYLIDAGRIDQLKREGLE